MKVAHLLQNSMTDPVKAVSIKKLTGDGLYTPLFTPDGIDGIVDGIVVGANDPRARSLDEGNLGVPGLGLPLQREHRFVVADALERGNRHLAHRQFGLACGEPLELEPRPDHRFSATA